jgi:hypothetical protein
MDKTDVIKLVGICSVNYRNFPEAGKEALLIDLWANMLSDVTYQIAEIAIKKYMSESVFPPTIADIRQRIAEVTKPRTVTPIEAWGNVTAVIRKYGSYNETKALEELDQLTRRAVQYFGYRELCLSENVMVDRAHFLKMFESLAERENKNNLLHPALQEVFTELEGKAYKRLT